jgi:hypothetical protein
LCARALFFKLVFRIRMVVAHSDLFEPGETSWMVRPRREVALSSVGTHLLLTLPNMQPERQMDVA